MSRFALLANLPSADQQTAVTNAISAQGASWWHWFPGAWLLDDPARRDLREWTEGLRRAVPELVFLLVDLDDPTRAPAGFVKPEWYEWIRQHWPQAGREGGAPERAAPRTSPQAGSPSAAAAAAAPGEPTRPDPGPAWRSLARKIPMSLPMASLHAFVDGYYRPDLQDPRLAIAVRAGLAAYGAGSGSDAAVREVLERFVLSSVDSADPRMFRTDLARDVAVLVVALEYNVERSPRPS